jgi:hypothetical protein
MNSQYNFTLTGGFPFDQGVLKDLQDGILLTETALANVLGPYVIISGCTVTGGSAANGVVAVNGQILPFVGGVISAKVIIVETDNNLTYENGSTPASNIVRYATFGDDGVTDWLWTNFVRASERLLSDMAANAANIATNTANIAANTAALATKGTVLASGNYYIGSDAADTEVTIAVALGTTSYKVFTQIVSETAGSPSHYDNDIICVVRNKTAAGFDIYYGAPVSGTGTNDISIDWIVFAI